MDRVAVIIELDDGTTYAIYSRTCRAISFQGHLEQWWTHHYKTKYKLWTDVIVLFVGLPLRQEHANLPAS